VVTYAHDIHDIQEKQLKIKEEEERDRKSIHKRAFYKKSSRKQKILLPQSVFVLLSRSLG